MAQMHQMSSTQRMADRILSTQGTSLADFLSEQHSRGLSYEQIARELDRITDGDVGVSYTTIKRWLIDFDLLKEAS